jgi:hypothetical protein
MGIETMAMGAADGSAGRYFRMHLVGVSIPSVAWSGAVPIVYPKFPK